MTNLNLHKLRPFESIMQNSLWNHDYYSELLDLNPYSTLEIERFNEPGIIRTIHLTLNIEGDNRSELLRNNFLMINYDHKPYPSVYAPLGDFFCDSFSAVSIPFASLVMAKRPTNSLFF